jgi:hypothetical protein
MPSDIKEDGDTELPSTSSSEKSHAETFVSVARSSNLEEEG